MKRVSSRTKPDAIAREDWDFERLAHLHRLNVDQLYFCMTYEYAREAPGIIKIFNEDFVYHSRIDRSEEWHYLVSRYRDSNENESPPHYLDVIDAPVGFPEKPYLTNFKHHKITDESYRPFNSSPSVSTVHKGERTTRHSDYYIHIRWRATNRELVKAFTKWLVANRPIESFQTRGKSKTRSYLKALKNLGAYRLIRHFGTVPKAQAYSMEQGHKHGLYVHEPEWSDAKNQVTETLKRWNNYDSYWRG